MAKRRAHGEGALYQRKSDGRWVGVLPAARSPTSKRRVVYGATRAEALAKLEALKADARAGTLARPGRATVAELLAEFLRGARVAGRTARTLALYEYACRVHLAPRIGHIRLAALTPAHLARLYDALLTQAPNRHGRGRPGLSATTVAAVHRVLHLALALAVRWRWVARNAADDVDPPRARPAEARALTAAQVRAFLLDAGARGDPLLAAWYLAADTGARRAELGALRWDDLDLDGPRPRAHIRRKLENKRTGPPAFGDPKTARSRRPLTISAATAAALRAHKAAQDAARLRDGRWRDYGLVFPAAHGFAGHPGRLYEHFKRAARRAGLPADLRLHGLRHSMATIALSGGASLDAVSRRLGHSTAAITLGTYNHAVATAEEHAAGVVAAALPDPPEPAPDGGSADAPAPLAFPRRHRAGGA